MVMGGIGEGEDGLSSFRDAGQNFSAHLEVEPFSQTKSKWIEGIGFEVGAWFCNVQRQGDVGTGWSHFLMPGFQYAVGPYRLRAVGGFQSYANNNSPNLGKTIGRNF